MGHIDDARERLFYLVQTIQDQLSEVFMEIDDEDDLTISKKAEYEKKYLQLYNKLNDLEETIHFL
jgi:hypothetical protein